MMDEPPNCDLQTRLVSSGRTTPSKPTAAAGVQERTPCPDPPGTGGASEESAAAPRALLVSYLYGLELSCVASRRDLDCNGSDADTLNFDWHRSLQLARRDKDARRNR